MLRRPSSRLVVAVAALGLSAGLAPAAASADEVNALRKSRVLPSPGGDPRPRALTLTALRVPTAAAPRVVTGSAWFRYRVTEGSRRWRRGVLVGVRLRCREEGGRGRSWDSPYTTTNWTWKAAGAVRRAKPGPDVQVVARALIPADPTGTVTAVRCTLLGHNDAGARDRAVHGRPSLQALGGAPGRRRTTIRVSAPFGASTATWAEPGAGTVIDPGSEAFVLRKGLRVTEGATNVRVLAGVQLTTCYRGTGSCPRSSSGRHFGTRVRTRIVVTPQDAARATCARALTSPEKETTVTNAVHHLKVLPQFDVDLTALPAGCGKRLAIKVRVSAGEGNVVYVHGRSYTNALALSTGD